MLQLIQAILKDPEDPTQCFLLFANQVALLFSVLGLQSYCVGRGMVPTGKTSPVPGSASGQGLPAGRGPSSTIRRTEH